MTQDNPLFLELLAAERHAHLVRESERRRLVRAAAARQRAARRVRPPLSALLYRAGALLVACGSVLVRWAGESDSRVRAPAARAQTHTLHAISL